MEKSIKDEKQIRESYTFRLLPYDIEFNVRK